MYIIQLKSWVKSNKNRTLQLKVSHFFVCAQHRSGIKNVFAQVTEWRKVLLNKKKN